MNKDELERRLEELKEQTLRQLDEIKCFKEQLEKMQDEPEIPEKTCFEIDEKFYYLNSETNGVEYSHWDNVDDTDFNMFHTEEYAKEFLQKCKLITMMLHCKWYLDKEYIPDWDNRVEDKYCLRFNHASQEFLVDSCRFLDFGSVCFSTEEKARKCSEWLNKHWKENS